MSKTISDSVSSSFSSSISNALTRTEKQVMISLSLISGLRMLGFFMLLPIFKELAAALNGAEASLIGLAMGIYGLVQAFLYLPLGVASDKYGRKPIILIGLALLIVGAIYAAYAPNIYHLIAARALQGAGAIAAVLTAFLTDVVRVEHRSKGLALTGAMIGLSFPLSLMLAPSLFAQVGQLGFFYTLAGLASLAFLVALTLLPNNQKLNQTLNDKINDKLNNKAVANLYYNRQDFIQALRLCYQPQLKTAMLGVIFLHALSMMFFYIAPQFITQNLNISTAKHWWVYLPVLAASFLLIAPLLKNRQKLHTAFSQVFFVLALLVLLLAILTGTPWLNYIGLIFYFMAFNYLEVMQPNIISQHVPPHLKGSVMGVYYTLQSIGIFMGAMLAGLIEKSSKILDISQSQKISEFFNMFGMGNININVADVLSKKHVFLWFFAIKIFFVLLWILIHQISKSSKVLKF